MRLNHPTKPQASSIFSLFYSGKFYIVKIIEVQLRVPLIDSTKTFPVSFIDIKFCIEQLKLLPKMLYMCVLDRHGSFDKIYLQ